MRESVNLQPGDIFLTRSAGLLGRLIRLFTRHFGEPRTMANHVGLIVTGGSLEEAVAVEALSRVRRHRLWEQYGPPSRDQVAVFRPVNLTPEEVAVVVAAAERYEGYRYGYFKILLHLLDWFFQGIYLFRRLGRMDRYPICSWVVAHAFAKAGKTFGMDPGAASPDDIWDFVNVHTDKYTCILPLGRMAGAGDREDGPPA